MKTHGVEEQYESENESLHNFIMEKLKSNPDPLRKESSNRELTFCEEVAKAMKNVTEKRLRPKSSINSNNDHAAADNTPKFHNQSVSSSDEAKKRNEKKLQKIIKKDTKDSI